MNKSLYDEAVADAQKLRELAEETAKNRVVEAVMPQIRDLVNRRILGEDIEIGDMPMSDEDEEQTHVDVSTDDDQSPVVGIDVTGDVNINLDVDNDEEDDNDLVLTDRMAEALDRLIKGELSPDEALEERVDTLHQQVKRLSEVFSAINVSELSDSQKERMEISFQRCVREALSLQSKIIITEQKTQERLERRLTETIKEMKHMSKSNRRNIFDFLFEAEVEKGMQEAELEEAELSLELTDDEQETLAGAEDTEAVDAALEDILGDLEVSLETEEGGDEAAEDAEGDEPDAEEPAAEEELDLGEGDYSEGDYSEGERAEGHYMEGEDLDEVFEIDENLLKQELAKMIQLREEAEPEDADPAAQHGGEVLGDVILDIDEDDLINVLADEIGNTDVPSTEPMIAVESRRPRRARVNRQLREARKQNAEYKEAIAGLKSQLVEMNLFNAKLLYANKLMQNKNLTMKQQKAIVEALDNAKTLREAKLLFKSLSESLTRRAKGSKLNEGSLRTIGSSSRSTRSAQPASSGVEVDRWAVLAGLPGKN